MSAEGRSFLAAVVQLNCTSDEERNWNQASDLVRLAAARGARLVSTPENTNFLGPHEEKVRRAEPLEGPTCSRFAELARELGIHLLLGSYNEKSSEPDRCYNTSVLFGPTGERVAAYRKIHLFDVDVDEGVRFQESATTVPGDDVVAASTPLVCIGLSICYDLRFPEVYSKLRDRGARAITVPSAFTATTGKAHWEPLLRARAIETQCYVLAAAQTGHHDDRGLRHSHGHSMVVDAWGQVLASVPEGPGVAVAEIDLDRLESVRRSIPVESHRRLAAP